MHVETVSHSTGSGNRDPNSDVAGIVFDGQLCKYGFSIQQTLLRRRVSSRFSARNNVADNILGSISRSRDGWNRVIRLSLLEYRFYFVEDLMLLGIVLRAN